MGRKRYFYDADGRLKGFSTDKFTPTFRGTAAALALFALGNVLFPDFFRAFNEPVKQSELSAERDPGTTEYVVKGVANVRSSPTTHESNVIGKMKDGTVISARPADDEWFEIKDGQFSGNYTWRGNLEQTGTS